MTQFYRSAALLLAAGHLYAVARDRPYTLDDHLYVGLLGVGVWIVAVVLESVKAWDRSPKD